MSRVPCNSPLTPCRRDAGQASTELAALLPLIAIVVALLWQLALAGHATWAAGAAARAAARAHALGADAGNAARARVPADLRAGMRVRVRSDGTVEVDLPIPSVAPSIRLGRASAAARHPSQAR